MTYNPYRDKHFGAPGERCVIRSMRAKGWFCEHTSIAMGKDGRDFDFRFWRDPDRKWTGEVKTQERYGETGNLWVLWENRPDGQRRTIQTCVATFFFIVCSDGIYGVRPEKLAQELTTAYRCNDPAVWKWVNEDLETLAMFTGEWFRRVVKPFTVPVCGSNPTVTRHLKLLNATSSF